MKTKLCSRCAAPITIAPHGCKKKYCEPCARAAHREAKYAYRDRRIIAQCSGKSGAAA